MEAASVRRQARTDLNAWLDKTVENPWPVFVSLLIVFLLVFGASILLVPRRYGRLIVGDGIYYYVYLRSAVLDHDLDFTNDYQLYQAFNNEDLNKKKQMLELNRTPLGKPGNLFSVGPALLWSPVYLLTDAAAGVFGLPRDGFSYFYEAPVLFLSILYGFAGIWLTYRVASGMYGKWAGLISTLGIWMATGVVYYMGVSPSASHVLSLFAVALFVYWWWRTREGRTNRDWLIWGACAGLMALVRWQDVLLVLLALFEWVDGWLRAAQKSSPLTATRQWLPAGLVFVVALVIVFSPQMAAWQILYGTPLTAPQGRSFFYFDRPEVWNVLFGLKRGLFTWTPIVFLAALGLIPLYRRYRLLAVTAVIVFALESYLNSIVYDWWGGEAFGARRFIGLMPLFALGLAALIDAGRKYLTRWRALALLGAFVAYNLLFILQYDLWLHGIGHISADPTLREITVDKFTAPLGLLSRIK